MRYDLKNYLTEIDKQQTILNNTNNLVLCTKDIIQLIMIKTTKQNSL